MKFDYEKKKWGTGEVDLSPGFLGATRLKHCLRALGPISGGKILEVGCGGGSFARAIKRHRPELEVLGCDLSREVITEAKKKDSGVEYRQADIYCLPFKETSFEAVVSFDVFEHLERPGQALAEVFRVLRPGGLLHFFAPIEGNSLTLFQLFSQRLYRIKKEYTGHVQAYTLRSLQELLIKIGFSFREARFSCFYLYQLVDLGYFGFLKLRGRNAAVSVEGYLDFAAGSFYDRLLGLGKSLFGWLTYGENEIWPILPGARSVAGGIHITAMKG
ncbi:MAG: class I SAM-dependent methyltransferase [Candidatus Pacebacteria bacterium]|nr:class I SAM-dependent methyltransferase [Candidatus Paceibacterota bacterium]